MRYHLSLSGTQTCLDFGGKVIQKLRWEIRQKLRWKLHHLRLGTFAFPGSTVISPSGWGLSGRFLLCSFALVDILTLRLNQRKATTVRGEDAFAKASTQMPTGVRREKIANHSIHPTAYHSSEQHLEEFFSILIRDVPLLLSSGDGVDDTPQIGVVESPLRADSQQQIIPGHGGSSFLAVAIVCSSCYVHPSYAGLVADCSKPGA